jgi:hypothetical protein
MTTATNRPRPGPPKPLGAAKAKAVKQAREEFTMELEMVDAVTAQKFLDKIDRQRRVRKQRVVSLASDIVEGNWIMSGEPFKFDADGRFIDGQHRCHAIIMADKVKPGISVEAVVMRGIAPEAMTVLDTGAARSAADQLNIADFDHPSLLASAAKWVLFFDKDVLYADRILRTATHTEIHRFVANNEPLQKIVATVASRLRKNIDAITPATLAASYYICWRIAPDEADWFFDKLSTGASLDEGSPILALRSRLREIRNNKTSLQPDVYISLVLRTWNAVREGREMAAIPIYRRGMSIKAPVPK